MFLSRAPLRILSQKFKQNVVRCLSDKKGNDGDKPPVWPPQQSEKRLEDWKVIDSSELKPPPAENPITRTHRVLKGDLMRLKKYIPGLNGQSSTEYATMWKHTLFGEGDTQLDIFPEHCDIVIIGGGAIGSSIAYYLKERAREGLRIVVLEQDKTYAKASTTLSVGGLRQQFSLEENILMSLYAADFLRNAKHFLGDHVNVNFVPHGYLFLATEEGAEQLQKNSILQNRLGAKNILLTPKKLKERFPWLNVDDIAIGKIGDKYFIVMLISVQSGKFTMILLFFLSLYPNRRVLRLGKGRLVRSMELTDGLQTQSTKLRRWIHWRWSD